MTDILIIEDNKEIADILCDFLRVEGYSVKVCDTGEQGIIFFEQEKAKLVILDIMLPNIDGFSVCKKIREHSNTPILIISAKTEKEDKLSGLILGADDYIEKPFDIDILTAKIQGIFKRRYQSSELVSGDIRLDKQRRIVYRKGKTITMTVKEFDLLQFFMENSGKTLSKELIFNKIWGFDSFSEPQTLTVHIKWLREKIEEQPKAPKHILTVWGVGYRFEEG
ncbi:MAG: response regulator transcription factor [Lachnospiraceae bacterium]|nr:response regulator transcription factor [Lachnospiraceae bacterium]MCI8824581.1 response regulator transcription factor [Lachnospiraceae bacterium]MCI9371348.1 response regulator transcription factor [Lachnospiraceae bacterium]